MMKFVEKTQQDLKYNGQYIFFTYNRKTIKLK